MNMGRGQKTRAPLFSGAAGRKASVMGFWDCLLYTSDAADE